MTLPQESMTIKHTFQAEISTQSARREKILMDYTARELYIFIQNRDRLGFKRLRSWRKTQKVMRIFDHQYQFQKIEKL